MQTKGKKIPKSITAAVLSIVLLASSLPIFPIAAAEWTHDFNPTPTFSEKAEERRYSAYKTASGGIAIVYPHATVSNYEKLDEDKKIEGYLIELVDTGKKDEMHTNEVLLRKTVPAEGLDVYEESISAAELRAIPGLEQGLLTNHRYSISITAYDSEGWFSETLYAHVSDVPMYVPRGVEPLTTDAHAARMMMDMNAAGTDTAVLLTGSASTDLSIIGAADQTGMEDTTGKDTTAYGFTIRNISGTEKGYMTAYSRESWDYSGAEEIWYWIDLSQVELHNLAFQMAANEKYLYRSDGTGTHDQQREADYLTEDSCVFSTAGYTGDDAYCWLQQEDGSWLKQSMPSGKMDLGHFRGYVRIPIRFFCLTKDSVVEADNDNWNTDYQVAMGTDQRDNRNSSAHSYVEEEAKAKMDEVYNTYFKFAEPVTVDKAGTPITDALLLQHFALYGRWKTGNGNVFTGTSKSYWGKEYGAMLAADITSSNVTNHNDKRAYIEDGEVVNRENGYKAIEDIKAAGFTYSGASADSLNKSFFIDNVLFYRTDHQPYPEQSLNGSPNTGDAVANYYDQTKEIPRAIFNACDQYLSDDPDWGDFRAVTYIEDMIKAYTEAFKDSEAGNDFLSEANLAATAEAINMEDSWQNFLDARKACQEAGTYGKDNNEAGDLVGMLTQEVEKLPELDASLTISEETQATIRKIWQVYDQLSLDQLDNLGARAEQKILDYVTELGSYLQRNSVPVGDTLASTPYIMFNDFEWAPIGMRAWQLENDTNAGNPGSKQPNNNYHRVDVDDLSTTDYRFKKSLVTYTGSTMHIFNGHTSDNASGGLTGGDSNVIDTLGNDLKNNGTIYWDPAWATIDENGFLGTHGLTTTIDSQYYSNNNGCYTAVSFTRNGAENEDPAQLRQQNTGLDSLGDFASSSTTIASGANPPICLVFYADFSELSNFRLSVVFHAYCPNHDNGDVEFEDFPLDFGTGEKRFWLLSPNTGEWVQCNVDNRIYTLPSSSGGNDGVEDLSLDNYRGYVMIPLEYFLSGRRGALNIGGYDYALSTDAPALNGIYRIQIGVAPLDAVNSDGNAAAAELDGRSFTIDNVGFSYEKNAYADAAAKRSDINFDEMIGAKSLTAEKFEQMVAGIDPYDDATLEEKVLEAEDFYADLTAYQKTLPSVRRASQALAVYRTYLSGARPAPSMSVDEIKAAIAALPDQMTGRDGRDPVRDEYDLPYPYNIDTDSIDYDKYGLTTTGTSQTDKQAEVNEKIQEILDLYEKQILCLTTVQEAEIGDEVLAQALHAYEAATRLRNLEAAFESAEAIRRDIALLYYVPGTDAPGESGTAADAFLKLEDNEGEKGQVAQLWERYKKLSFYAKYMLDNMGGTLAGQHESVVITLERLLRNIYTVPLGKSGDWSGHGELTGGVLQLKARYESLYAAAKANIKARQPVSNLEEIYKRHEKYHSLVNAYYSILDLYNLWHDANDADADGYADGIYPLFPVEQVALNNKTDEETTITLRPDTLRGSAQYNVQYSVFLPSQSDTESLSYLTVTSENGKLMQDGTSYQADYTVEINRPSSASTIPSTTNANTPASVSYAASALQTETEIGKVANNVATTRSPRNYTFNVRLASDPAAPVMLEDTLTVQFYRGDGTVIESATKKINILYVPGDGYSVTIPAEVPIKWGETKPQDVSYTVLTTLSAGYIEVSVADNDEHPGVLISNTGEEISFTTSDKFSDKQKFDGLMTKKTSPDPKPTLTVSDWSGKVPNKYTTQLTYTVSYTDDSTG